MKDLTFEELFEDSKEELKLLLMMIAKKGEKIVVKK